MCPVDPNEPRLELYVRSPIRTHVAEALVGLAIALLLLWVAVAAVSDVPFVYQGL